jgi:hypothetical protein
MKGLGHDLPTTGPAAPKPSRDRPAGARIGVKAAPTAAAPIPTARGSMSKRNKALSEDTYLNVDWGG